ncbi:BREX-1 system adenine-specific DNA-methyltransferase PglX [Aeromonas hydrophila]|uniref:BREX-1 system adenine-specific DNA-methyltransferase PglX n=1 Tax=Aeromonas hydrophila TaxID=644 RepID=UPI001F4C441D|nr:BREX-1 system adenine-specific DNA-methyltransferase PglX [Aeromonas hydrophila]MCO4198692.1 BREX-1 system adenine-specific DNA-methyltransferase PglX [Aeromonas hydrophila]UNB60028.1 BREX-1 system adenine-specific DNA-methyltransferase PglX [Aeromonas hydrophila]
MAFDQSTRGRLQKLVNTCRSLLSDEFSIQLQQTYGLDPKTGEVTPMARLTHLDDRQRHTAEVLRQTLAHYLGADVDDTDHRIAVLDRIVREQAFTVLNRLAALLMMEARGQLIESVSKGYQSRGYQLYSKIASTALGETGQAYQVYLFSVFDELAQELPALFERYAANGLLFPRETALRALLDELNHFEIEQLWAEDETIGWIYQYFNSKEERKAMRDASQAPRNSRELAVRNQFFTPRYVVEFLVDNTLGRLWFNATGGQTDLRDRCQYLLVKPDEQPQVTIKLRDPRTLKLLDPACGSMHFGLYAFDLFAEIYREAWAWEQQHGPGSLDVSTQPQAALKPLSQTYDDETAFLRDVPRLIIEHNIYGVDIDPRAAQIATLALWLRAQRAWHDAGVKAKDRPLIGHGHVVAAVAPPAERELRQQFTANLDRLDTELFEKTLQLLKGLPEMGVLLQVERELPNLIRQVYVGKGTGLFAEQEQESWKQAEARLCPALNEFASAAKSTYQGRLFAQDALQGLRLIDLCREVFDVVVMNPPFGEPSLLTTDYLNKAYPSWNQNLLCAFILRSLNLLAQRGLVGAIFDKTALIKSTYQDFREVSLYANLNPISMVDLGWGILDGAQVETALTVWGQDISESAVLSLAAVSLEEKSSFLSNASNQYREGVQSEFYRLGLDEIVLFPNKSIPFDASPWILRLLQKKLHVKDVVGKAMVGCQIKSDVNFRLFWEIPESESIGISTVWSTMFNGGSFSPFLMPLRDVVRFGVRGNAVPFSESTFLRNLDSQQTQGYAWGKRGDLVDTTLLPEGCVFTTEGQAITHPLDDGWALAYLNSKLYWFLINQFCGQHKYAGYVNVCPAPKFSAEEKVSLSDSARQIAFIYKSFFCLDETCREFLSPFPFGADTKLASVIEILVRKYRETTVVIDSLYEKINEIIYGNCDLSPEEIDSVEAFSSQVSSIAESLKLNVDQSKIEENYAKSLVSYAVGLCFRRWDLERAFSHELLVSDPAIILPSKQPGRMLGCENNSYVYDSSFSAKHGLGVLVASQLEKIFGDEFSDSETKICAALKTGSIATYISDNLFFTHHLENYSRNGRNAPIYWPLSTASGSYTLWVYYPSLNNQTLFTAVNDFLDGPDGKLTQVSRECAELRVKGSGRSRDEEKEYDMLQSFERELTDLRDTLLKIAPTYQPNHDDGVQITAAPLWPLFRHKAWQKALKDTWTKLEKGNYDWAHLAMTYWPERVREKCKTDKSLAIAHGLEDLYIELEKAPKKTRSKKKVGTNA